MHRRSYRSPGPNECWHVDGYDKLKSFGFPVHGAVDGYSRRILWLVVARSNNDPLVIGKKFFESIKEIGGCPRLMRSDLGSENETMAAIQCYLLADGEHDLAGEKAHRYGPSKSNQRIECFWSFLRRSRMSWWMNFFKDLNDNCALILASAMHKENIWFCFNHIIQTDLDFVKLHYIRPSRHETTTGRPDELFFLPEGSGGPNQLQPVKSPKPLMLKRLLAILKIIKTTDDDDDDDDS